MPTLKGGTLQQLAGDYETTTEELQKLNPNLRTDTTYTVGEVKFPEVDTSQPSPTQIQQSQDLFKVPTASKGPGGETIYDIFKGDQQLQEPEFAKMGVNVADIQEGQAPASFKSKFETGFNQANQALGDKADVSDGTSLVNQYSPARTNDFSSMFVQQDEVIGGLVKAFQDYINPANQRTSLRDEYSKMLKDTGIQQIDLELVDMKAVIDGTEDDIKDEITKSGGFATSSQVTALTLSRNKQLIKNYNKLVDTRNAKSKYLETALQLEQADRASADQRFNNMFNMGVQIANMQQQMQQNAHNQMQWLASNIGFDGLYDSTGGDPYYTNLVEKTLGLPQGGLLSSANQSRLARAQAEEGRRLDLEVKRGQIKTPEEKALDIQYKKAQINNLYSEIEKRNNEMFSAGGIDEKTMGKIQASPEYKTINGVLPAIQALKAYKDAIEKYGTVERVGGEGAGTLKGTYGNALATWKTLAGLGALSGADFTLAENAIPTTGFFRRKSTSRAKLESSISNAIAQAENLTKRLQQNYPKAAALLNQQLDEMKVTAYPDKFVVGDDGLIYELE